MLKTWYIQYIALIVQLWYKYCDTLHSKQIYIKAAISCNKIKQMNIKSI